MSKDTKPRDAGPEDKRIGGLIRTRRIEQKMSQAQLGDTLGVSFQQVQKYEKGVNRIGAPRLQQIAAALDVPVTFFFDKPTSKGTLPDYMTTFMTTPLGQRVARAFQDLKTDPTMQNRFLALLEGMAERLSPKKK